MGFQRLTPDLLFREAFDIWLNRRTVAGVVRLAKVRYISDKTRKDYLANERALSKYFGFMRLGDIRPSDLMIYQNARAVCDQSVAAWAQAAGAKCIRKEIALLLRMLREAGVWGEEQDEIFVRIQREDLDVPKALSTEEQARFLATAAARQEFHFIYWYALLALDSTCSAGELRCLKLGDIALEDGLIMVRRASAKNRYRMRTIVLTEDESIWALGRLIDRAKELGASSPQHYLFPVKEEGRDYDPTKPMTEWGLKKRFDAVRDAANLSWFKPNGFRHTGLTRLAEGGTPIHVLMARAGHIEQRTQQHYIQISLAAQRRHSKRQITQREPAGNPVMPPRKPPARQASPVLKPAAGGGRFWISSTTGF